MTGDGDKRKSHLKKGEEKDPRDAKDKPPALQVLN